jgi:hypothetical protein
MNSVRTELAAAVRRVNAIYARRGDPKPEVVGGDWDRLEAEVDAAIKDGDRDRALAAIRAWEAHAMRILGGGR